MQMIDVLKRLAELDATNSNVVKEGTQVQECGPMGMMDSMPGMHGMMAEKPSVPANFSINASAATGNEVADMMSQILTLAGMKQVGADDLGAEPQGALVTAEPAMSVGPMAAEPMPTAADDMRSVLDKLNPEPAGDDSGDDLGPFQHDSQAGDEEGGDEEGSDDGVSQAHGDIDNDGDHDMDDHDAEEDDEEEEETDEGQYDNSPADPTDAPAFDSEEQAHHENQPGSGETSNGEKRQSNLPTATFENLMQAYKEFIGEGADMDKIPAYVRKEKQKSQDAAQKATDARNEKSGAKVWSSKRTNEGTCSSCHKEPCECSTNESLDILKLAGLK